MEENERKDVSTQATQSDGTAGNQVKKGKKGLIIGLVIVGIVLAAFVIWRVCIDNSKVENKPASEVNQLIIGYYGWPGEGPGTYMKLSNNGTDKYKAEYLDRFYADISDEASKNIYTFETLNIESAREDFYQGYKEEFKTEEVELNSDIEELIDYVQDLNLEKMSKKKYDANVYDGLYWDFFIKVNDEEYTISGYHNMPEELEKVLDYLEEIVTE